MKKLFKSLAVFFLAAATMLLGTGCSSTPRQSDANSNDSSSTQCLLIEGGRRRFFLGSTFSHSGLTVYKQTDDGQIHAVEEGSYTVDCTSFDGNTEGEYTITVNLTGSKLSAEYNVQVLGVKAQSDRLKVLMIGNSFSDDTIEYAWHIASDLGIKEIVLGNLFIAGCDLSTHYTNAYRNIANYIFRVWENGEWVNYAKSTIDRGIAYADWDFITLQQASGLSGYEASYKHLEKLSQHVREKATNKDVQVLWNMTWAYQQNSTHKDFVKYDNDQATMYQAIISCINNKVSAVDIDGIIPCGTAVQNGRLSVYEDTWTRDGFHLSLIQGRYLAGVTLVGTLTGRDVGTLQYMPSGTTKAQREVIKQCAADAIKNPFTPVTP